MCLVVGGHHHRGAGAVDPVQQLHDADGGLRVEVAGRLVRDQQHRPVDERAGDRDALLLTTGELAGHPVLLAGRGRPGRAPRGRPCGSSPRGLPITSSANATFSRDGLVGQQPEVLEDRAQLAPHLRDLPVGQPGQVLAQDVHRPGVGALLAQDQPQEGRLAGAGRAHQEDELALLDLQRDVPQGRTVLLGVGLGDVVESDHGCTTGRPGGERDSRTRLSRAPTLREATAGAQSPMSAGGGCHLPFGHKARKSGQAGHPGLPGSAGHGRGAPNGGTWHSGGGSRDRGSTSPGTGDRPAALVGGEEEIA